MQRPSRNAGSAATTIQCLPEVALYVYLPFPTKNSQHIFHRPLKNYGLYFDGDVRSSFYADMMRTVILLC